MIRSWVFTWPSKITQPCHFARRKKEAGVCEQQTWNNKQNLIDESYTEKKKKSSPSQKREDQTLERPLVDSDFKVPQA